MLIIVLSLSQKNWLLIIICEINTGFKWMLKGSLIALGIPLCKGKLIHLVQSFFNSSLHPHPHMHTMFCGVWRDRLETFCQWLDMLAGFFNCFSIVLVNREMFKNTSGVGRISFLLKTEKNSVYKYPCMGRCSWGVVGFGCFMKLNNLRQKQVKQVFWRKRKSCFKFCAKLLGVKWSTWKENLILCPDWVFFLKGPQWSHCE